MRLLFVPLLVASILIGWTMGLVGCALSAGEQGWVPVPTPVSSLPRLPMDMTDYPLAGGSPRMGLGLDASVALVDVGSPSADAPPSEPDAWLASDAGVPPPGSDAGPLGDLVARCGDGVLSLGEDCDDGNLLDGDGCSAGCLLE